MHRAEPGFVLCIHWSGWGLWCSHQRGPLVYTDIVQLPTHVNPDHQALPCQHGRTSPLKWQSVWSFWDQWGKPGLCPSTSPLQLVLASSTTLYRVLMRECISTTTMMVPYSTIANSQLSQRLWLISSRQHCLLMTSHSWHTSPVTYKPCWTDSQIPQSYFAWPSALERLFQPAPNSSAPQPTIITMNGMEMNTFKSFKYLGSIISSDGQLDKEISVRISKESQALGRLCNRVLIYHNISLTTKLKVYRAVVLTSLLLCLWVLDYLLSSHQVAGEVPYASTPFHPGYPVAGQNHQSQKSWTEPIRPPSKWCCWKPCSTGLATSSGWVIEFIPKQLFFG